MGLSLRLKQSEKERAQIDLQQQKQIRKLYEDVLDDVKDWSKRLEGKDNISSILRTQYLKDMEKDIDNKLSDLGRRLEQQTKANMLMTSLAVAKDTNRLFDQMGIHLGTSYSFVPADIVRSVYTGKIYSGNWTMSKAIWNLTGKNKSDIHEIIAKGIAMNKSSYDIAKELEKYVNPKAAKPWDWSKIYPGSSKKVDYNAQRLARTMISHAYEQSFIAATINNPFIEGYEWLIAGDHKVCEICTEYAETQHSPDLPVGVFPKHELPIDHPNGRCTFAVYIEKDIDTITNELADWVAGGKNADIEYYAKSLGYTEEAFKSVLKN